MKIGVMQPYFYPYLGYFKLLSKIDLFVIYDCVQFPRRGWVHRNKLTSQNGALNWITLPLLKAPQAATQINDLAFHPNFEKDMALRLGEFPVWNLINPSERQELLDPTSSVVNYLEKHLLNTIQKLGISTPIVRSSDLQLDPLLKGQSRILEIVKHFKGTEYINPSGGSALYDIEVFKDEGVNLTIMKPYEGSRVSMLERLIQESRGSLIQEIFDN